MNMACGGQPKDNTMAQAPPIPNKSLSTLKRWKQCWFNHKRIHDREHWFAVRQEWNERRNKGEKEQKMAE